MTTRAQKAAQALDALAGGMTGAQKAALDAALTKAAETWAMTPEDVYALAIRIAKLASDTKDLTEWLKAHVPESAKGQLVEMVKNLE